MTASAEAVILLGAGGHARVLADALGAAGCDIAGVSDPDRDRAKDAFAGIPVLSDADVLGRAPDTVVLVNGVGGIGDTAPRRDLFLRFKARGFRFATVVHPAAAVAREAVLGEGAQIMAGAVIQTSARVGENTLINIGVVVDHDCNIGAHCHLAPGSALSGKVCLGAETHIGTGASLIHDIVVGARCLIGAGAVVIRDVPDDIRAVGVPAKW